MAMVSAEISSAVHHIILNAAALIASTTTTTTTTTTTSISAASVSNYPSDPPDPKTPTRAKRAKYPSKEEFLAIKEEEERSEEALGDQPDIVELDAVELLAEHVHFCEICGKGFKRDANLRMHMRAHGNQFKTPEALAKPEKAAAAADSAATRFSCPYEGCNRNRKHNKFRPLKSVICVRNHFKRSHCPRMYSCNRCNKKSFSVVADLKSHLKHCGEPRWKCSCGTSFSRKDKLFGHMALFEGHMPAVVGVAATEEEEEEDGVAVKEEEEQTLEGNNKHCVDDGFFDGLLFDGFGSTVDGFTLQDVLMGSPNNNSNNNINGFWENDIGMI